jgi:hypothetical protein
LEDKDLHLQVCLASRADNRSKLVSEFVRAFMRRIGQIRKPPQRADTGSNYDIVLKPRTA